jgi:hypothetical protein
MNVLLYKASGDPIDDTWEQIESTKKGPVRKIITLENFNDLKDLFLKHGSFFVLKSSNPGAELDIMIYDDYIE